MKSSSINTSIPASKTVRGYAIERMPIGQFLKATLLLQELPTTIMQSLFPDADVSDVLKQMQGLTKDTLIALFLQAAGVLPEQVIHIFAELSGIPEDKLMSDPDIGLDGLMELVDAWIEVNGIVNFTKAVSALLAKVRKTTVQNGSSD